LITLAGWLALANLPLAQYPAVTPPTVQVNCNYPGASAQVVAETVAAPIEQQVNGVERMHYMESSSANDGSYNLSVTFEQGMNLNLAQVLVQNRVNLALPMLPDVIKQTGVTTRKRVPDILMCVNIVSPHGRYDQLYLSNYALMRVRDELLRIPGIGDIFIAGQRDYSMRIWVDPEKLTSRNLTASDVVAALREQNAEVACGQIGGQPVPRGQETQFPVTTLGRLKNPAQFADMILRATPDGRIVRIRDVGRVVLGPKNEDLSCRCNNMGSAGLIIFQLPDANALEVGDAIKAKMVELKKDFPDDLEYVIRYDTTPYTRQCIDEVVKALRDAIILVALVVLLFLQNWRSAIIPLIAVPVAIIGTFAVMYVMGFSLNNLTLFGLVLAIGIVVDDAIVVVEAAEHHIENGMAPRDATIKAMSQVSGPVVAVGLVLSAVFVPCAFISGITGQFFRQFALTIAASTVISAFNSLTLSPALSALLLRPREKGGEVLPRLAYALAGGWAAWEFGGPRLAAWLEGAAPTAAALAATAPWIAAAAGAVAGWLVGLPLNFVLGRAFRLFNDAFARATNIYLRGVGMLLRTSAVVLVVYCGMLGLTYWAYVATPKGFVPTQDMGYLLVAFQLPDAASAERTEALTYRVEQICKTVPGVNNPVAYNGQSFLLSVNGSNFSSMFVNLDDFEQRQTPDLYADAIADRLRKKLTREVPEAMVVVVGAPPIRGIGRTGGFKFVVEDRGDLGLNALQQQTANLVAKGNRLTGPNGRPPLIGLSSVFRANAPQIYVNVNRQQCMTMGVPLGDLFDTLQVYLGSLYVNDFNLFGRTWQVIVQADAPHRIQKETLGQLKVRNSTGGMVPVGTMASTKDVNGPLLISRYNTHTAASINGATALGISSRQGIDLMAKLAKEELPKGMAYEWTEMAFFEVQAGNTAMAIFAVSVLMVFLVLAAQYESWSLPLAVILVVPMCLLCAIVGVSALPMLMPKSMSGGGPADINIFTQIGFVVLVGLASKNAILIVEFAKHQREEGRPRHEATLAACKLRLRPIVMTSAAFILGSLPLLIAHGAGAEMRRTLGTAVFSGMLGVTAFGIFLTPVFFNVIDWLGNTPVFRSRRVRFAGHALIYVLTFSFVATLIRVLIASVRPSAPPEPTEPFDETIEEEDTH
ncbi:MAG: multidrug efflux RND transporter permease subunit, partial [Thermoguttaceae bacterium]